MGDGGGEERINYKEVKRNYKGRSIAPALLLTYQIMFPPHEEFFLNSKIAS